MVVVQDLHALKYTELQKLAKSVGIRANQKVEKLIKALTSHYIESESLEKERSNCKKLTTPISKTPKNALIFSPCLSSVSKPSPSLSAKSLVEKRKDGSSIQTPGKTPGNTERRKRRRTFELEEASIQGNTPTIDGQAETKTLQKGMPKKTPSASGKKTLLSEKRSTILSSKAYSPISASDCKVQAQTPVQRGGKKRRRTFELNEASLQGGTPTIDETEKSTKQDSSRKRSPSLEVCSQNVSKRLRRSTSNKDLASSHSNNSSPGTKAIIEAMDANCSNSERRRRLLSIISNKVKQTVATSASSKASQPSQIPRFTNFTNKKQESQKSMTPGNKNWKKIHNKEFSKFDSIDVYLEKRKQRQDELSSSTKKTLPFGSPAGRAKPVIAKPVDKKAGSTKIFQPQVTSVKNISFNFNKMASSTSKTPSRQAVTTSAKGNTPATSHKAPKLPDSNHKASVGRATPFKFTGNSSFLKQAAPAKSAFDLKASLARPMTWKPHTGKLQPLDTNKDQLIHTQRPKGAIAHRNLASKTKTAKVKKVQRTAVLDRRSNQKYIDMMKKRGLLA